MMVSMLTERLKDLRLQLKLSQKEMAERLGVGFRSWQDYESGRRVPGSAVIEALCAMGVNANWLLAGSGKAFGRTEAAVTVPLRGLATCGMKGWFQPDELRATIPAPADLAEDAEAFAVVAQGVSLQPEGIRAGHVCFCSPLVAPVVGDIVYVQDRRGYAAMKVYQGEQKGWLQLQGWLPAENNEEQKPYIEQRLKTDLVCIAPVIYIKRR